MTCCTTSFQCVVTTALLFISIYESYRATCCKNTPLLPRVSVRVSVIETTPADSPASSRRWRRGVGDLGCCMLGKKMAKIDERPPACVAGRWDGGKVSKTIPLLTEWVQAIRAQSSRSSSKFLAGGEKKGNNAPESLRSISEIKGSPSFSHTRKLTAFSEALWRNIMLWCAFIWMLRCSITGSRCSWHLKWAVLTSCTSLKIDNLLHVPYVIENLNFRSYAKWMKWIFPYEEQI